MTPKRIVCLTEETTEWLYLLGEQDRIVGISAYTERPAQAKREKPVVSAFIGGHVEKIKALKPDLVIGFSDVQAELAHDLVKTNLQVLITNQRSITEILGVLNLVGRMIGAEKKAEVLTRSYEQRIKQIRQERAQWATRPKVYFEEWDEPMLSAIQWVSELIEIAGGENIFADRAHGLASMERKVELDELIERSPELYLGCWCGKALDRESLRARPGIRSVPAIAQDQIFEIDPAIILQPGPACLTDGLDELCRIMDQYVAAR